MRTNQITNFQPGNLTKDGFLGNDIRSIKEIVEQDREAIVNYGLSDVLIADRLQWYIFEGQKALESIIQLGEYSVQIQYDRGMLPCPFGEPGLHLKLIATVRFPKIGKEIQYSQLSVHLIRHHGFYGGKGSPFRLEPKELIIYFLSGGEK